MRALYTLLMAPLCNPPCHLAQKAYKILHTAGAEENFSLGYTRIRVDCRTLGGGGLQVDQGGGGTHRDEALERCSPQQDVWPKHTHSEAQRGHQPVEKLPDPDGA